MRYEHCISYSGDYISTAVFTEVYDTYTYSDVGFDGDACPPCIVMQPPLTTLQAWMDTQDRIDLVWEEQVHSSTPDVYCTEIILVLTSCSVYMFKQAG